MLDLGIPQKATAVRRLLTNEEVLEEIKAVRRELDAKRRS